MEDIITLGIQLTKSPYIKIHYLDVYVQYVRIYIFRCMYICITRESKLKTWLVAKSFESAGYLAALFGVMMSGQVSLSPMTTIRVLAYYGPFICVPGQMVKEGLDVVTRSHLGTCEHSKYVRMQNSNIQT